MIVPRVVLPPAAVIASWPSPNYEDPVTRGTALLVVNSVFLAISSIFVLLRIYTRVFMVKSFGWDDLFICIGQVLSIGVNVTVDIGGISYGWNRHVWDIPLNWLTTSFKLAYVAKLLFTVAAFSIMTSLIAFYYRLVRDASMAWFRKVLHVAMVWNVVTFLVFFLLQIFECLPVTAAWELNYHASCMNQGWATMWGGAIKTFTEFVITTLPIPIVMNLTMHKNQKIGIAVLLGVGYLVTIAGIVRTYFTYRVFFTTYDQTWMQYPAFLASAVENDLAVICACIPPLRPMFLLLCKPITTIVSRLRTSAFESNKSGQSWQSSTIGGGRSGGPPPQGSRRAQKNDPDKPWAIEMRESFEITHSVNPTSTDELHRPVDDDEPHEQRNNSMRNNSMRKNGINQMYDDDASATQETMTKFPY